MLSEVHSDILDARVGGVVQAAGYWQKTALSALLSSTSPISFEAFQDYAVVLDVDGGRLPAGAGAVDAVLRWMVSKDQAAVSRSCLRLRNTDAH
jgi:hypothetical protein